MSVDGVKNIDDLKTRIHGPKIFVDVEIAVDADMDVTQGHLIAENVHQEIEKDFSDVKHCMVHVNPYFGD
jgi:divalent metal cation (Fe/Co/Zn/Cd) transporter